MLKGAIENSFQHAQDAVSRCLPLAPRVIVIVSNANGRLRLSRRSGANPPRLQGKLIAPRRQPLGRQLFQLLVAEVRENEGIEGVFHTAYGLGLLLGASGCKVIPNGIRDRIGTRVNYSGVRQRLVLTPSADRILGLPIIESGVTVSLKRIVS
jgi:hypothetical protein